jgi:uncharacterized protein (TIGR02453 family)
VKETPFDLDVHPPFGGFPREGISFLARLRKNNNRKWFALHRDEYIDFVKSPMESLIAALAQPIGAFAPEMLVDPKKCMFRIHRDTRFSSNKDPYKTHVAALFHPKGHWNESAGFYLHIEPGEVYLGGGIYMPDGAQLKKIRRAIAGRPGEFLSVVEDPAFRRRFGGLGGEKLSRAPLGFAADDPMIEWLKFKQFFVGVEWDEGAAHRRDFVGRVARTFNGILPLARFLNSALRP